MFHFMHIWIHAITLQVSEDILIERVVGRRLDPVTGKIYHLKYSPPENEETAARLTQRFDDTEEKVFLLTLPHTITQSFQLQHFSIYVILFTCQSPFVLHIIDQIDIMS